MRRLTPSEGIKVLAFLGVILLCVTCWAGYKGYTYKKNCTAQTQGEISYVRRGSRTMHIKYEVEFEANGNYYIAKGGTHGFDMINAGELKEVHYNPNDPEESYAGSMPKEWAYICTYVVFYSIIALLTYVFILLSPRSKKVND